MKIMAVDFGDARTGLAVCDKMEFLASPAGVIHEYNFQKVLQKVAEAAGKCGAQMIVVGHPLNMNGTAGAQKCADFAKALSELVEVPVHLWDERSTTVTAHQYLNDTDTRRKKRKAVVDAVAATVILESYLNFRKNHPGQTVE